MPTPALDQLPLDHDLSPHTGWTRAHWEATADRMLLALRPFASPGRARFDLPGPASRSGRVSDGLEGFARSFLLAAFRLKGAGGDDPHGFAQWYADGLAAGTDPASGEAWPSFDAVGQAKVEAASVAIGLHETRPWVWDRLDAAAQERVLGWLSGMIGTGTPPNNWTWFRAISNAVLRSLGGPSSETDIAYAIDVTDGWYAGDGWFSDGMPAPGAFVNMDYYNAWAMHYYPLWLARVLGDDAYPEFTARSRERLNRFLQDAQHMVAADGAPMFQGRSLTYRFAMTMPYWLGALNDCTPLAPGLTRRLGSGTLRHFLDRGALDDNGLLTIGWYRAFMPMRQPYSGPGSPYWASKAFAGLLLPADHPVWTAREEPLPVELGDTSVTIRPAGWVLTGTKADGIVRLTNHGAAHAAPDHLGPDAPHYARIGLSTHAAPDYPHDAWINPYGSQAALVTPQGAVSLRTAWELVEIRDRVGISRHRAHWQMSEETSVGPWLTVASASQGAWEVRLARVEPDGDDRDPGRDQPRADGPFHLRMDGYTIVPGTVRAEIRDAGGLPLAGTIERTAVNPMGDASVTDWVMTDGPVEADRVHAALVLLSGGEPGPPPAVSIDGDTATIDWADGKVDTVTLPGLPSPR